MLGRKAALLALLALAAILVCSHATPILAAAEEVAGCHASEPPHIVQCTGAGRCPFEQVHVSLGVFDTETGRWNATFGWASQHPKGVHAAPRVPMVRLAASSEALLTPGGCVVTAEGTTGNYSITTPYWTEFTTPANWHYASPPLHHASVGQLESQTRYYYQVGRKGLYRDSVFSFRTPVAPGVAPKKGVRPEVAANPDHPPLTIYTIGDIGQTDNSLRTRDMILSRYGQTAGEGFALIIGDLAYADGGADRWDSFGRLMEPLLSAMPLMVLPGNHEIEVDNTTHETFLPYRHRYNMPEVLPEKTAPIRNGMWKGRPVADMSYEGGSSFYSFEVGYVHFLMLNTYDTHGGLDGNENAQAEFAAADLASVDRERTPFVLVFTHGPMYNNNAGHQDEPETMIMKAWLEPLLNKHKVNCVLAGHVHAYERMHGIELGGKLNHAAPMYITVGDGGNHERLYPDWVSPLPATSAYHDGHFYGHGELKVFNKTHILWSWVPNPAQVGELPYDSYWIAPRGKAFGSKKIHPVGMPLSFVLLYAIPGLILIIGLAWLCFRRCCRQHTLGTEREGLLHEGLVQ